MFLTSRDGGLMEQSIINIDNSHDFAEKRNSVGVSLEQDDLLTKSME
jgi:hypothetical protein